MKTWDIRAFEGDGVCSRTGQTSHENPFIDVSDVIALWRNSKSIANINSDWCRSYNDTDHEFGPSKRLWMAVLLCAIKDLEPFKIPGGIIKQSDNEVTAKQWVVSSDTDPGSLVWVCEALDIPVDELRSVLLDAIKAYREEHKTWTKNASTIGTPSRKHSRLRRNT